MKILVIGSGGREHAIVRKLKESPQVTEIFCVPGNGGIACDAVCVPISAMDIDGVVKFSKDNKINLVFVAPDDPLAAGMVDALEEQGIMSFGPSKKAAEIESSKVFSKGLMKKYAIPTAAYETFSDIDEATRYVKTQNKYPTVIKADGLALGKGVVIAQNEAEAVEAIRSMMEDKIFGESGTNVVIEEFLVGPEVTVLAFTDGKTMKPMVSSKDHKRAYDGDKGANTGGMGTISPNPFYTDEIADECMAKIFLPTMNAMNKDGRTFKGCLYFGLILTSDGAKVIEYNARFGDPETQVILPKLKTDLVDIISAIYHETLEEIEIRWSDEVCACVVMASGGYPGSYEKGIEIHGLDECGQLDGAIIIHAGDSLENGKFYTNGGRVLGVTALGKNLDEALNVAYNAVDKISFSGAMYRSDIGKI